MSLSSFDITKKLGEGAYSQVYQVRRKTDCVVYALKKVKIMNLSTKERENALNEVRILASIHNPNVISYKEAFFDDEIMEYADGGDLYQKILEHQRKGCYMSEQFLWNLFIQITKGLKALHELNILHRDLKCANVFLNTDGTVKLGDMNVSKVAKNGFLYTQTGTPYYASPEVWMDKPYNIKSDIWSLGCVLYEAITLKPPFRAEDMQGLYRKVVKGEFVRIPRTFSNDLSNLVSSLLQIDFKKRPNCGKIYLDDILGATCITRRLKMISSNQDEEEESELLGTIKLPSDVTILATRLPGPNYKDELRYNLSEPSPARSAFALPKISLQEKLKSKNNSLRIDQSLSRITVQRKSNESQGNNSSVRSLSQNPANKSYKDIIKHNYGPLRLPKLQNNASSYIYKITDRKSALRKDVASSIDSDIHHHENSYSINPASRKSGLTQLNANTKASRAYLKPKWWAV